jgi:DNA-binding NtrC family response regulator
VELADGGTLFLDEIGNMPLPQQARLLRVLQTGEYTPVGASRTRRADLRVVSATNTELDEAIAHGRYREDLLYRLNTVELRLPPLRERREDLPLLAAHFLSTQAARYRKDLQGFTPDALEALLQHPWPGNVRELEHVVERATLLAAGSRIDVEDLSLHPPSGKGLALEGMTLDEAEKRLVEQAVQRAGGNVSLAAGRLGLSRAALYRRLAAYGRKGAG